MLKAVPAAKQERLLATYKALPGWPATLDGLPLRKALGLARRQQSWKGHELQLKYERALAESRQAKNGAGR